MTPGHRALAVVMLLAGLGGCGPKFWNKPGATLEDFNRDSAACSKEANTQYGIFVNDVYRAYFTKGFPARAFLGTGSLLAGGRFEVQGIAVKQ